MDILPVSFGLFNNPISKTSVGDIGELSERIFLRIECHRPWPPQMHTHHHKGQ